MGDDGRLGHDLGEGGVVKQAGGGDAVEVAAAGDAPVQGLAVGGESDAIGAEGVVNDGEAGAGDLVDDFSPDVGDD